MRVAIQNQLSNLIRDHDRLRNIIQELESDKETLTTQLRSNADKISKLELTLSEQKSYTTNESRKVINDRSIHLRLRLS
jgi:septal ring factor EnvC (AmiA/AmiB activator)